MARAGCAAAAAVVAEAVHEVYKKFATPAVATENVILNPYTGDVVESVPFLTREAAIEVLKELSVAQKKWAALPLSERIRAVQQGADHIEENTDAIAQSMTATIGKPIGQSKHEIGAGVGKMRQLCEQAEAALAPERGINGDFVYEVRRVPKGVVEIIAPWNYPIFCALNGAVPALLAGNAVALKHQSIPAVGEWFARAFRERGGAPIAHLHVDIPTSDWIGANVDVVAHRVFTGSVRGGRAVAATLGSRAQNEKLSAPFVGCSLELGGCDAAYIHKDLQGDDLKHAVEFITLIGRLHNTGQSCCATKRVVVHPDVLPTFENIASSNFKKQKLGDPSEEGTTIGPVYGGAKACANMASVVLDARDKGAKVLIAGEDCTGLGATALKAKLTYQEKHGHFVVPTLLVGATLEMRCMSEEVFGPVLAVAVAPSELDKAIEVMQCTTYGLTSSVWTRDDEVANAVISNMSVGTCFVNWCNDVQPQVVWSGVGLSGNGNGAMGSEGFRVLTNPKSVVKRKAPMPFP
eukprot:CAMPEP_0179136682 /NCGR_PEP_ID=MMETSP0796-20121207/65147_1 /TAXON_ID=73915 /ORGANISM="Pyrodinium bahamense, Strain pbaha01" /LENGTH=520 /DNA_ID=CAMNT_0020835783 /DNA_START=30 /DNA_END=1592 /DNA_ORIENTATION=+